MKSSCDISIVDDILLESIITNNEFIEFSNVVSNLTSFANYELYFESIKDTTPNLRSFGTGVKKNTWDTTKDIGHAYGNIVNANSNLIKSSWDVVMRAISLISRALGFIINKITNIPKFIIKTADRAMDIPGELKSKIRGDITLNITAKDIELIYNNLLIQRIREYITLASELSKGEFFSTFFNKRNIVPDAPTLNSVSKYGNESNVKKITKSGVNVAIGTLNTPSKTANKIKNTVFGTNDMKLCRKMDKVYTHFNNIEFKPTIITMNDQSIVNIYFGNSKSIKFTDNYGKSHECNYYEALNTMMDDINSMKKELETVQELVGDKLRLTEANQNYNRLDGHAKHRLGITISQMSKVVSIIGNFTRYIMTDINTINNSIDKILTKGSKFSKVSGKNASNTPADKVNTKV